MKCPHCGFDSPPQMLFCGICGAQLARRCPACGFVNPLAYSFCGMCGVSLGAVAEAETPPASLPEPPELIGESQSQDISSSPPTMGGYEPTSGVPPLTGERRVATVLLADVCGSTRILEQVGTEAWVQLMSGLFQVLEAEIYRFGGAVDQFRGDGLVAFFGARVAHEDDPERGVLAALAMQHAVERYADHLKTPLQIRIGVNTGKVIVTRIGDRRQYSEETAMGEAVTLAARLEAAAEPGTVLASENTYQLLENQFEWQQLDAMQLKGLREPVPVYRPQFPLWRVDNLPLQTELYGGLPSLIGHREEFAALKRAVEELYDARGGIVTVTGAKGMGKTFLVGKARQHLERQGMLLAEARRRDLSSGETSPANARPDPLPVATWLSGRCRSYDQSWPYSVWVDLLLDWLAVPMEEPKAETRERLRQQSQRLWGERFAEYYPYLATLLRLPLEAEFAALLERLDAEGRHRRIFLAIRNWVIALARKSPLVLSFSDMHWVDSTSLDLLRYVLPLCDTEALLWVLTFRPDRHALSWDFYHYVETEYPHRWTDIFIPPLVDAQSAEFINHLLGAAALPAEVSELVIRKAEGNPYYIKELLNALMAQGILVQEVAGNWQTSRPVTSLDVPDSLQTLLLARVDRLTVEERQLLQVAAVIGTVFWEKVLRDLLEELPTFAASLTNLQRAQFIEERRRVPDLGMEYGFTSSLVREVIYDSLLTDQREAYHLQTAEYLASFIASEEERPHRYGMVAYHYRQAGLLAKALDYALKAAERAAAFYANAEARYHYTYALELLAELLAGELPAEERHSWLRQRFAVLDARREVHYLRGDLDSGRADALAMLELARQELPADRDLMIDALLEQPGVGSVQGREERTAGVQLAQEALWRAQELGDQPRELRAWLALTNLYNLGSDPAWRQSGQRALELARQLGDRHAEVDALLLLAGGYGLDNLEQARGYYEQALQIAQRWDDKAAELTVLAIARTPSIWEGDYYRALVEYERPRLKISRAIGNRYAEGAALMSCGQFQGLWLGDLEAGLELEEASLQILENLTSRLYALLRLAQLRIVMGQLEEAQTIIQRARPVSEEEVRELGRAGLRLVEALLYNELGDKAQLIQVFEAVSGVHQMVQNGLISRQYGMAAFCEESVAHLQLIPLSERAEERAEHQHAALGTSQTALDIYEQFGFVQIVECTSEELFYRHFQSLQANGRDAEAAEYLQRAHAEMMRKYALIPADSHFRQTYLENLPLHRQIAAAFSQITGTQKCADGPIL